MGAIHLEQSEKGAAWVFESYKHAMEGQNFEFGDVGLALGSVYATATKTHDA